MFNLVLRYVCLNVKGHLVQEGVDLSNLSLCALLDLIHLVVEHVGQFLSLHLTLPVEQVEFIENDLIDFDELLVCKVEILVRH